MCKYIELIFLRNDEYILFRVISRMVIETRVVQRDKSRSSFFSLDLEYFIQQFHLDEPLGVQPSSPGPPLAQVFD